MTLRRVRQSRDPWPQPEQWSASALEGRSGKSGRVTERSRARGLLARCAIWLRERGEHKLSMECRLILRETGAGPSGLYSLYRLVDALSNHTAMTDAQLVPELAAAARDYRLARGFRQDACLCCFEDELRAKGRPA